MRIVADKNIAHAAEACAAFGELTLVEGRTLSRDRLLAAEALLVRSVTRVDAALLAGTPVQFVGSATAGTDHIDLEYLRDAGIAFAAAPGCNARAVAEYVLACVLGYCLASGRAPATLSAGIIGHGHTGTAVEGLLSRLGLRCLVNDPPLAMLAPAAGYVSLQAALGADIVSLHVPLTAVGPHPTRQLIGAGELDRIDATGLLLNAARGGVVDEADWVARLARLPAARAAIDCWSDEPAVRPDLLRQAWIATPHIAGHTVDARERATAMLCTALARHYGGRADWTPPSARTASAAITLDGAGASAFETVAAAVLACCDPGAPTALLRQTLGFPQARRRACFDELRSRFGDRREFTHYTVASVAPGSDTAVLLASLGFSTAS